MSPELAAARAKMERIPVHSLADFWTLDPDEVEEGYAAAREGFGCGDNRSRAYWHGWTCAQCDMGKQEPTAMHRLFVSEAVKTFGDVTRMVPFHRKQFAWLKSMGLA
ncbi:hypothetical protein UFOVP1204_35 [uncultured Caudovirales phage]|uniref:Uncharacterized protein n=1 Tax=uncultured Caudovirales phage TaxID=2100421 RepID=A0A6J5Q5R5_9CAUD|nr:hypothetical protein UFOVP473_66 [uncultured Caudovirales phage]CAB4176878.1 hypothetical protein UFOVP983_66 [uncultured Caudovirales phage]CAB4189981.1 hypothetical protein UFOVP1204_35 [uncultured Caudovirales phage]